MIVRFSLSVGVLLMAVAWALTVIWPPADHQTSVASMADAYRAAGMLPPAGELVMSPAIGHDVFEIPETDADHAAEEATADDDEDHGDMPMKGMAREKGHGEMPKADMPMKGMASMEGMAGEGGHGGGGPASGLTVMAQGRLGATAAMQVSRTVEIKMVEWGYTPASLMATPGEVLRLVIRNAGNMPHEFMIMKQSGMQAVNYRLERADWNLTEHEALFEKPVVMPGDSFEMIVRIDKPGMWMFMCMFPYHMQLGMMGMVMTEGMSMGGMNMGGMKMDMGGGSMSGMKMDKGGSMGGMKMDKGGAMGGMKMDKGGAMGGKE